MKERKSFPVIVSFPRFIWIALACFFTASASHCVPSDDEGTGPGFDGDPLIFEVVRESLQNWEINLKVGQISKSRNTGNGLTAANPPNWITMAPRSAICDVPGVPRSLKDMCPIRPDTTVLGVCFVRFLPFSSSGEIVDTTLVVVLDNINVRNKNYLTSIFSHEIGHCFGLQHWGDNVQREPGTVSDHQKHLMYPRVTSVFVPHEKELSAAKAVYNTENGCSQNGGNCIDPRKLPNYNRCGISNTPYADYEDYHPCYFISTGFYYQHHKKFPEFTLFASAGSENAASPEEEMPPPGPSFDEPLKTHMYVIYADGTEKVYTNGS